MACMNMYNNSDTNTTNSGIPQMGPRISFSNDFVVDSSGPCIKHERPLDPAAPGFEFSSIPPGNRNHPMIAADEVFFKGRLVTLNDRKLTLREELMLGNEGHSRPSAKVSLRWKEFLGLRKPTTTATATNIGVAGKKNDHHYQHTTLSGIEE